MKGTAGGNGLYPSISVRIAETPDGAVLLDITQGLCFSINPVGAIIWKHINEGCDPCQIAQHLVDKFRISSEQAHTDVGEFLQELREKQLLHEFGSTTAQSWRFRIFAEVLRGCWKRNRRKNVNHTG